MFVFIAIMVLPDISVRCGIISIDHFLYSCTMNVTLVFLYLLLMVRQAHNQPMCWSIPLLVAGLIHLIVRRLDPNYVCHGIKIVFAVAAIVQFGGAFNEFNQVKKNK